MSDFRAILCVIVAFPSDVVLCCVVIIAFIVVGGVETGSVL
jgi:hypothetical protein